MTASRTRTTAQVIVALFDEAEHRDPAHARPWVHVMEYLWKAAWCFYREGDTTAETWVAGHALRILPGHPATVAAAIRRKATTLGLDPTRRKNADTTATYLIDKKPYLDYPTALAAGWPIATGIIEGTCRHLVKDRMDITGACWGLDGAETVLRLRTLTSSGDFDTYWTWHLTREHHRTHLTHYQDHTLAACPGHSRRAAPFRFR